MERTNPQVIDKGKIWSLIPETLPYLRYKAIFSFVILGTIELPLYNLFAYTNFNRRINCSLIRAHDPDIDEWFSDLLF